MAHHIVRRCLLADVVPPVPPSLEMDDRLFLAPAFAIALDGVEFGSSVGGLSVLGELLIVPIPPGADTGAALDRVSLDPRFYGPEIPFPGLELWGESFPGAYT